MARRSSSSREVLLGLLSVEPMSGYDLGQSIRASIGFFWNESYGQIYPNLKKLAAAGLVTAKTEKQKGKPDRQVYSITPRGRQHLERWLAVEPQPEVPRNELLLKLFFGAQARPKTVIGYVERMAKREKTYLEKFRQVEREMMPQMDRLPRRAVLADGGALRATGAGSAFALGGRDAGGAAQPRQTPSTGGRKGKTPCR